MKSLLILLLLPLLATAADSWQLEKVVEIGRHGVRPPTAANRAEIEAATQHPWPRWSTADGELTGHGYSAVVNKGRWQGNYYRQAGLLHAGCPDSRQIYVRASPLQRTRATAQALTDGAFPGCGVPVHVVADGADPLFQSDKFPFARTDPAREQAAIAARAGDLAALQQRLQPAIRQLNAAVCDGDCRFFSRPWQLKQTRSGHSYIQGLSVMASMVETLRLGWSENLPPEALAQGRLNSAQQITALLPLLTANYDLSNDVPYLAQKRGSILLDAAIAALEDRPGSPDTRWLLLVAHDTNIAMVRTLMHFSWQLPGYARGNIPPGSSLVFERWRDTRDNSRRLRIYFQAQSLDALRQLAPVDRQHPLLQAEWHQPDCHDSAIGTLCPYQSTLAQLRQGVDSSALAPVTWAP